MGMSGAGFLTLFEKVSPATVAGSSWGGGEEISTTRAQDKKKFSAKTSEGPSLYQTRTLTQARKTIGAVVCWKTFATPTLR